MTALEQLLVRDIQNTDEYRRIVDPRHLASVYVYRVRYMAARTIDDTLAAVLGGNHDKERKLYRELWLRLRHPYRIRTKRRFWELVRSLIREEMEKVAPDAEKIVAEIENEIANLPY